MVAVLRRLFEVFREMELTTPSTTVIHSGWADKLRCDEVTLKEQGKKKESGPGHLFLSCDSSLMRIILGP